MDRFYMGLNPFPAFFITLMLACLFTAFGWAAGRKISFAGTVARWGTVVMLFAAFLPVSFEFFTNAALENILLWWLNPCFVSMALSLAAVALCVFRPKKAAYVTALLAEFIGWAYWIWRGHVVILEQLAGKFFEWEIDAFSQRTIVSICYAIALFLCGMGLGAADRRKEQILSEQDSEAEHKTSSSFLSGLLFLLSEPFAGQQIPLPAGEEICLGNDPADCQLVLDLPGEPRCLCRVSWLDGRNCYSVMACEYSSLLYEDGTPVPVNEPVMAEPGTVFMDGQTGQAVFQLGS